MPWRKQCYKSLIFALKVGWVGEFAVCSENGLRCILGSSSNLGNLEGDGGMRSDIHTAQGTAYMPGVSQVEDARMHPMGERTGLCRAGLPDRTHPL